MEKNIIRLEKEENIVNFTIEDSEGNETGETLSFDLEDVDLPFKYQEFIDRYEKSKARFISKFAVIDKKPDIKGNKIYSANEEEKIKVLKSYYKEQVEIYNIFLGKKGVQKLLNGRSLNWSMMIKINKIIDEQIAPKLNFTVNNMLEIIKKEYGKKEEENVLE